MHADPTDPVEPTIPEPGPDTAPDFDETPAEPPAVIDEPQRNTEF